jgi:hypothetical protein
MKYLKRMSILILFEEHYLVNQITDDMKDEVIRLYLHGLSRNDIARTCGVGEGTLSNIIDEWKHSLDIPDIQSLRDLVIRPYSHRIAHILLDLHPVPYHLQMFHILLPDPLVL